MARFKLICKLSIKWWVRPLITACKVWVFVSHKDIDADRLSNFIVHHGMKKKFTTE